MTTMDTPPATTMVSLTIEGSQANLTLTRPDKFNAMNVAMIQELILLLEWTAERSAGRCNTLHDKEGSPYLRTLVLRGEGKHFCAGADIPELRHRDLVPQRRGAQLGQRVFERLAQLEVPSVAVVQEEALQPQFDLSSLHTFPYPSDRSEVRNAS